jgi:hypothetical protein
MVCLTEGTWMKQLCEYMSEGCAAAAVMLWFASASIRLKRNAIRRGLESGFDGPNSLGLQAKSLERLGGQSLPD